MSANSNMNPQEAKLYQDNIDFTHSTTMSFDYSFTGTAGAGGGVATVEIFFTANGTQTFALQRLYFCINSFLKL